MHRCLRAKWRGAAVSARETTHVERKDEVDVRIFRTGAAVAVVGLAAAGLSAVCSEFEVSRSLCRGFELYLFYAVCDATQTLLGLVLS